MTTITISSADAERIARQFSDLISAKGLQRIRRVAINQIGAGLRRNTKAIAPPIYGTTAAALMVQGTAAKPGSDDPRYLLRMARSISIGRLRAANRKTRRVRGKLSLTVNTPATSPIRFSSVERVGKAFRLTRAGPLPERFVGGIRTGARTAFAPQRDGGVEELHQLRKRAAKDLPAAIATAINDHLKRRMR